MDRYTLQKHFLHLVIILITITLTGGSARAHDLWLNLEHSYLPGPDNALAKVVFGHNYPHYGILLSAEQLSQFYYLTPDGKKKEITDTWEEIKGKSYGRPAGARVGKVIADRDGIYLIAAARKRKGDLKNVPSEKYAKSVMVVGADSGSVDRVLGHRIEIVPLESPARIHPGGTMPVRILFEGRPLSTYVYGTYAGYSSEDEPFPVLARSDENGVAMVPLDRAGTWMLVTNHKVDFSASLTFQVR
ncbi:DUF4198 domain-containing protein [Desulfolithobacter sp.]